MYQVYPHQKVGVFCLRRNSGQVGSGEICLGKRGVYIVTTMNTFQTKLPTGLTGKLV